MFYMARFFFQLNDLNPMEIDKRLSDIGYRVPGSWQDLMHFSRNFGEVKDKTELDFKGGYKRHKLQEK